MRFLFANILNHVIALVLTFVAATTMAAAARQGLPVTRLVTSYVNIKPM